MTRVNLISPRLLTDQHLIAEKKELNQLAGQLQKSVNSKNFNFDTLPKEFKLGTGHVRFFYRYGKFIKDRYQLVYDECVTRRFDVSYDFNDVWSRLGPQFCNQFIPASKDLTLSKNRIIDKIKAKPEFYRYKRKKIDAEEYCRLFLQDKIYEKREQ